MTGRRDDRPGGTEPPGPERGAGYAADVVGVLSGACPPGASRPRDVPLREGDRCLVGRPSRLRPPPAGDGVFLSLGPGVRRSVPAVALVLAVARSAVHLRAGHGAVDLLVDGAVPAPGGIRLAGPEHEIVVDPVGVPRALAVRLFGTPPALEPPPASGTTRLPVLRVSGDRLLPMAVALAWPAVTGVPRPRADGWSLPQIVARHRELWGGGPVEPRHTLFRLREILAGARCADGRPMAAIEDVQPWPWAERLEDTPYLDNESFMAAKNRITAGYFAAAGQVRPHLVEALARRTR
ncbi:hypothetical protein NX794_31190 [Streptomyces sp. LP11]|uniref:Uncharacterized protein n=1 Tax=Streptomyces pyxinicus TaxID=2970331 RepID=A0ABT2BAS4_9ACTN|nr:hypothetical protein [Streptomyces sp. LP11]MCS0605634.1 hypothetical protein [Streptomyces sp. LP11]